jgi:membrane protein required for colicin V production
MNWIDYVIIGIIGMSALISLVRGFVREVLSLVVWVLAFALAWAYFRDLALYFQDWVHSPSLRLALAFALVFLVVLVLGGVLGFIVGQLVDKTGLSGTDRLLGMVFGAGRGAVLVAILVLLSGLTPLPGDAWWQESGLIPQFQRLALWLLGLLPPDIASKFRFT